MCQSYADTGVYQITVIRVLLYVIVDRSTSSNLRDVTIMMHCHILFLQHNYTQK